MQCALVTGTTRGIGQAVAKRLLEDGWLVLGVARGAPPADLAHDRYAHASVDLSNATELAAWLDHGGAIGHALMSCDRFGLVNNAGVLDPMTLIHRAPAEELSRAFAINAVAPMVLTGHVVRECPRSTPLRIVDLSSGAATSPYPGWGAYCATKAALRMAGRALAEEIETSDELRERDVRILSFAPGVVDTRMQDEIRKADAQDFPHVAKFEELNRDGALVDPKEPARAIADWLASDPDARFEERRFGA